MGKLDGKIALVTGANTGIGKVTAEELARHGAKVIYACRSRDKAEAAMAEARAKVPDADLDFLALDLSSLEQVRTAAEGFLATGSPLHLLINNAGLAGKGGKTKDGFELAFGVNHLGHFLFTELLLPRVIESAPARIINVASKAHYKAEGIDFDAIHQPTATTTGLREYEVSKLANVLYAKELAERVAEHDVTTYSLHPGVVASDVWREVPWPFRSLMKLFMISNEDGAKTTIHCAISEEAAKESGLYYDECKVKEPSKHALDLALARELTERSRDLVGLA